MNNNDIFFYENYLKPKHTDPVLDRVRSWQHEIQDMLPAGDFTVNDLNEICHRFGFYQYHLVNHLLELNMIKRLDRDLFKKTK